jgi:excisionase family DNA binding protein
MSMATTNSTATKLRLLLTVPEAAEVLGVGRSVLYELVQAGEITSIKIGRSRRIVLASLQDFVLRQARISIRQEEGCSETRGTTWGNGWLVSGWSSNCWGSWRSVGGCARW